MKNKTKKILVGVVLGVVGAGTLAGCATGIPTDYNFNTTINSQSQYRLTVINDSNYGVITPRLENDTNSVMVDAGDSYTFTIKPNEGYQIDNLLIDGQMVEPQEVYSFINIDKDHSIGAVYSRINFEPEVVDKRNLICSLKMIGMDWKSAWYDRESDYEEGAVSSTLNVFHDKSIYGLDYALEETEVSLINQTVSFWPWMNESSVGSCEIDVNSDYQLVFGESGNIKLGVKWTYDYRPNYYTFDRMDLKYCGNDYFTNLYCLEINEMDALFPDTINFGNIRFLFEAEFVI